MQRLFSLSFNTTSVSVRDIPVIFNFDCIFVSIQLLCRFEKMFHRDKHFRSRFQYNFCVGSSMPNTTKEFEKTSFNTTSVSVRENEKKLARKFFEFQYNFCVGSRNKQLYHMEGL